MARGEAPGTEERGGRGERLAIAVVLLVALALRVVYLFQIREHPLFTTLTGDPAVYFAQARDILSGTTVPPHAYFHSSPLYPFFLALLTKLGLSSLHALRLVQSLVGTLSVYLVFVLGRLTVGRRAGLVAAALAALYTPLIFFEGEVLEITLVMAFVLGSLVLLVRAGERPVVSRVAAAGALLGLAGLGKPNLLLFAPVGAVWLYLSRGGGDRDRRARRSRALTAVLFFAAAGLVILPATVHNYRAEGDFIPVSSNGGINFFIGNHLNSPGVFQVPPEMRFDLRVASAEAAERAEGRQLSAGEVSDHWTRETVRQIRGNPARWMSLMSRKFGLFWNHYEIPNHYHFYYVRRFAPVLRLPVGTFAVVAPLGLFGIALAALRKKRVGLLMAFGLTFMASVLPFFVTGRYRLAVVAVLLVGAGYAVTGLFDWLRSRDWRALAGGAAVVAVLAVAVNVDTIEFGFAQMHNSVGAVLGRRGDMAGAAVEFEKAVAENPLDLSARYNLGLALLELERFEEASAHLERATADHPRYYEAWIGLGRAFAGLGREDEALEAWAAVVNMEPPAPAGAVAEASRMIESLRMEPDEGTENTE